MPGGPGSAEREPWGGIARNEANFSIADWRQTCRVRPHRPNMQNEPNLPGAPRNGRGRPGPGGPRANRLCKTNPICPARPGGTRHGGRGACGKCAKQSQFTDRDRNARVKQSQFADKNRDGRGKQSQTPALRSARGLWNPPPYAGAGRRGQLACSLAWLPVTWCSFELETRLCSQRERSV